LKLFLNSYFLTFETLISGLNGSPRASPWYSARADKNQYVYECILYRSIVKHYNRVSFQVNPNVAKAGELQSQGVNRERCSDKTHRIDLDANTKGQVLYFNTCSGRLGILKIFSVYIVKACILPDISEINADLQNLVQ